MVHPFQGLESKGQNDITQTKNNRPEIVSGRVCVLKSWCILDHSRRNSSKKILNNRFFPKSISIKKLLEIFWIWAWSFFPLSFRSLIWTSPFFQGTQRSNPRPVPPRYDRMLGSDVKPSPESGGVRWLFEATKESGMKRKKTQSKQVFTLPKTNMSPEHWWLEDVFPIEIVPF